MKHALAHQWMRVMADDYGFTLDWCGRCGALFEQEEGKPGKVTSVPLTVGGLEAGDPNICRFTERTAP
jgi:hypothetical protein